MSVLEETWAQLDPVRRSVLLGGAALGVVGAVLFAAEVLPDAQVVRLLVEGKNSFHAWSLLGVFGLHLLQLERAQGARAALLGLGLEVLISGARAALGFPLWAGVGLGLGLFALGHRALLAARAVAAERPAQLIICFDMLTVVLFPAVTAALLSLTALVRPLTWDGLLLQAEAGFGVPLERGVITLFREVPAVKAVSSTLYLLLLAALALVHGLRHRLDPRRNTTLAAFLLVGVVGYVIYFFFPVAGPVFTFPGVADGAAWVVPPGPVRPPAVPRNCMPSLHGAWAMVIFFQTRGLRRAVRVAAGVFLAGTLLATLGLGFHYLVDLVVALPLAVVLDGLARPVTASAAVARRGWLLGGAGVVLGWLLLLRFGSAALGATPGLLWLLTAGTCGFSWLARRALRDLPLEPLPGRTVGIGPAPTPARRGVVVIGLAFVMSGLASIVYEVVFAKSLALTFGSTSLAQTAVLATYMGGIGLGSWWGARWVQGRSDPLRVYAWCEAGVAAWCLLAPLVLTATQHAYVTLAGGSDPAAPATLGLQVVLSVATLLVPTVLMGATTPALAQHFSLQARELAPSIRLLYGANTLGAGLGALLTGYFLLPRFGIQSTLFVAVALNLGAAAVAYRLHGRGLSQRPVEAPGAPEVSVPVVSKELRLAAWCALGVLTLGGAVSLALEVLSVHLLAVVAGTSAYAFSLMLATFLLGLSLGAATGSRFKADGALGPVLMMQAALAASVLGGVFVWEQLPEYFLGFNGYARAQTFAEREFIRAVVCVVALFPPAFFVGASYPLAMAAVVKAFPAAPVRAFGVASGLNTAGNIVGALGAHFVLVPHLGSLRSLQVLAAVALVLAVVPLLLRAAPVRGGVLVPLAAALVAFVLQPRAFDLSRLASGANVYFLDQGYGEVIDHAESSDGGLTTIARSLDKAGRVTLTMLTNGKFQGDDSVDREVPAQYGFALAPLLHTQARGSALVVGYGTGCSAAALHQAGFGALDIVELSDDVVKLADRYFTTVNDAVTSKPGVRTFITDGRNFLLLRSEQYDLVSMEISSIWFAGAAALYNEEFYELVSRRLKPGGVLQQWVQLHRLLPVDVAAILTSVRTRFEKVWLYFVRGQGVIVACNHDCQPVPENAALLDAVPAFKEPLATYGGSSSALSQMLVLDPAGTDRFIDSVAKATGKASVMELVSNDDNLLLEYSTPRANVRPYAASLKHNLGVLEKFGGHGR